MKLKTYLIIGGILIATVPILFYMLNISAKWTGFWGSYLGAVFTILALVFTILYNQKQIEKRYDIEKVNNIYNTEKELLFKYRSILDLSKYHGLTGEKFLLALKLDVANINTEIKMHSEAFKNAQITSELEFYEVISNILKKYQDNMDDFPTALNAFEKIKNIKEERRFSTSSDDNNSQLSNILNSMSKNIFIKEIEEYSKKSDFNIVGYNYYEIICITAHGYIMRFYADNQENFIIKYDKYLKDLETEKDRKIKAINNRIF